jgi:hypothetical protein
VNVTSTQLLGLEKVSSILEAGFDVRTGGQRRFRNLLQENDAFETILAIEIRQGLAPPQEPPTPTPSVTPTETPTADPTATPTGFPTASPSRAPTANPTKVLSTTNPTKVFSEEPTQYSSETPSHRPSRSPTETPTHAPSAVPTARSPSIIPTTMLVNTVPVNGPIVGTEPTDSNTPPTGASINHGTNSNINNNNNNNLRYDPVVIAAIAGGAATILVTCLFMVCIWCRQRKQEKKKRQHPKVALTSQDGQLNRDGRGFIPGIVELDQRSLADTTLGEETAGRQRPKKKKRFPQAIQPLESFDDSSLYTTPFSLQLEEDSSSYPPSSTLSSHLVVKPLDYEGNMLLPLSDSATESSDGIYSSGPTSSGPVSVDEGPIDLDSEEPYDPEVPRKAGPIDLDTDAPYGGIFPAAGDESRARQVSRAMEDGHVDLDPYEIDEWSCDAFEDFSRGTDFYEDEVMSKSPSYSSKSTAKMENISSVLGALAAPEENSQYSYNSAEEEKREVDEMFDGFKSPNEKEMLFGDKANHSVQSTEENNSSKLYMDLMTDDQSLETPTSPSSLKSAKSHSSKKSTASWSSWGSRKGQPGQPPLYPNSESRKSQTQVQEDPNNLDQASYQSPLRKLFDSVTTAASHSIPVVTPEGEEPESDMDESAENSQLKGDDSTLLGLHVKDDVSASSGSTGMSPNPWLFEQIEQSLGPKSVTADMESLSGKSNLSVKSPGNRSKTGTEASFGSQFSFRSGLTQSEISFTPRTLEHDLKRLELQLAALDTDQLSTTSFGVSSITGASLSTISSRNRAPKISRKKRIVVMVPPGKLGVILANRHDGKGTVVSEVREHSSLKGMLSPGDKLVGVDDEDVTGMVVSQITSLMASKADRERRLTVITSIAQHYSQVEFKSDK